MNIVKHTIWNAEGLGLQNILLILETVSGMIQSPKHVFSPGYERPTFLNVAEVSQVVRNDY